MPNIYSIPGVHPSSIIHPDCVIEPGAYIGPFCLIGFPAEKKGFEHSKGKVVIRSGARLEGFVTVDSGTERPTEIGQGCMLMKRAHVGHDAAIGDNAVLAPGVVIAGFCRIGRGCTFGMNSTIHQRLELPPYCMVGANAAVTKKTEMLPLSIYVGVPAVWKKWNLAAAERFALSISEIESLFAGLRFRPDFHAEKTAP